MSIPDPDPLTADDWALIEEAVQEAAARARDLADQQTPGGMHRLLLAQAAKLETALHRLREAHA